jgi:hypothetical protein
VLSLLGPNLEPADYEGLHLAGVSSRSKRRRELCPWLPSVRVSEGFAELRSLDPKTLNHAMLCFHFEGATLTPLISREPGLRMAPVTLPESSVTNAMRVWSPPSA